MLMSNNLYRYSLLPRALLRDSGNSNALVRIVALDIESDRVWLTGVDDDLWPYPMPASQFFAEFESDSPRYTIEPADPYSSRRVITDQRPKTEDVHNRRWDVLRPLIISNEADLLFFRHHRKRLIRERAASASCSTQFICNILKLYWKRGMNFYALTPAFDNCGGKGKRRRSTNAPGVPKLGRPRTVTPGTGINIDDRAERALRAAANYFLQPSEPSLQDAWDHMSRLYYAERNVDEYGNLIGFTVDPDGQPTKRQLQYYLDKHYPDSTRKKRRLGQHKWDLTKRAITGRGDQGTHGPGDRFQVDATVADVYLVSSFDRRRIVGRPVIYFVVDVWSCLIVGVYVGFEGPSWVGAMMALTSMASPKVGFCKQFGVEISEEDWPAHHLPKRLLGDRGELLSVRLGAEIVDHLTIDIENATAGRGDLKAFVERDFGTVPARFRQFTPGYVKQDFGERGARDYRLDAKLNLNEFTALVLYAVLLHNSHPIEGNDYPPEMVTDGLAGSPLDLWNWGIQYRSGSLRVLSIDEVALAVMPRDRARVTAKGLRFKGEYYTSPTALREEWFSKARMNEWNVDVSYDPRDLHQLYIRDRSLPHGFEVARMIHDDSRRRLITLFEVEEIDIDKKRIRAAAERPLQEKRVLYAEHMEAIKNIAVQATDSVLDKGASKASRIKSIRSNRADEKAIQRGTEALSLQNADGDLSSTTEPPSAHNDQFTATNMELLRKLHQSRLDTKQQRSDVSDDE